MKTETFRRNIAIINVGANSTHGKLISALFEDDSFLFTPIPERSMYSKCANLPTFGDLLSGRPEIMALIPTKYYEMRAHNDPEFETFTYGDYPESVAKAANLRKLQPRDLLFFFARLTRVSGTAITREWGFYFIGFFEIENILARVNTRPSKEQMRIFGINAHIKRGLANLSFFDGFWVFKGSSQSKLFKHAVPFNVELASKIVIREGKGQPFGWLPQEEAYIGYRTRACRLITDNRRKRVLLKAVLERNEIPLFRKVLELNEL